ncbi:exonuclease [Curvibacter phage PCA1]|nr:exonuclease [Curvibacter phage PCA1]
MAYHAKLSPSSASRWSSCTASPGQEAGKPNEGNPASRSGTADHLVSSECLERNVEPSTYLGRTLLFWQHSVTGSTGETWSNEFLDDDKLVVCYQVVIDEESVARCVSYVEFVRELAMVTGGHLLIEQRVPIEQITGEKGATGTSDTVILCQDEIIIADAKFGQGRVNAYDVVAKATATEPAKMVPNKQLAMYAHGTLTQNAWMGSFKRIRMIIVQPRLNHVSEFSMTVEALEKFVDTLRVAAEETRTNPKFVPNGDNCFFCKGRRTCPERERLVLETTLGDFDDLTAVTEPAPIVRNRLGDLFDKLGMIRQWCDDVHHRVVEALTAHEPVERSDGLTYKLVAGRRGHRAWTDPKLVEELMLGYRIKSEHMYTRELISPSAAAALAKQKKRVKGGEEPPEPVLGKKRWERLQQLIVQPDGKPEVALETDHRPSIEIADFDDLDAKPVTAASVESDLFN